jgi:hypothetical protein
MTKDNSTGKPKDFYSRGQREFDRLNKQQNDDDDTQGYTSELALSQCKWPTCQNKEYQEALAAQVKQELYTGRPWQGLTDNDWAWVADRKGTSLDTFDQGAAWAAARLKERNT